MYINYDVHQSPILSQAPPSSAQYQREKGGFQIYASLSKKLQPIQCKLPGCTDEKEFKQCWQWKDHLHQKHKMDETEVEEHVSAYGEYY